MQLILFGICDAIGVYGVCVLVVLVSGYLQANFVPGEEVSEAEESFALGYSLEQEPGSGFNSDSFVFKVPCSGKSQSCGIWGCDQFSGGAIWLG